MKATVADIARICHLSTATVDRVLNHRTGVSAMNRQRVMSAATQLGYLPTIGTVALPSRPAHLEFFLPVGTNMFIADLARHIEAYAAQLPLVASCRIRALDGISPRALRNAFQDLSLEADGVGVVAVDHPTVHNVLREIVDSGPRLVTLLSDIPAVPRSAYVGIDNRAAGRTAALLMGRFLRGEAGTLALLVGSRSYRGHEEREAGFRSVLREDFPHLVVVSAAENHDEPDMGYAATMKVLQNDPGLLGIYCVGGGRSGLVRALSEHRPKRRPVVICHDLTRNTQRYLLDDVVDVVIDQNATLVAEQAVLHLLGSIAAAVPYLNTKMIEPRIIVKENIPTQ